MKRCDYVDFLWCEKTKRTILTRRVKLREVRKSNRQLYDREKEMGKCWISRRKGKRMSIIWRHPTPRFHSWERWILSARDNAAAEPTKNCFQSYKNKSMVKNKWVKALNIVGVAIKLIWSDDCLTIWDANVDWRTEECPFIERSNSVE